MTEMYDYIAKADEYIASGDVQALTALLDEVIKKNRKVFHYYDCFGDKHSLSLLAEKVKQIIWTKPELYEDEELTKAAGTFLHEYHGPFLMNNSEAVRILFYGEIIKAIENRSPERMKSINAALGIAHQSLGNNLGEIMDDILFSVLHYKDYELMMQMADEICNIFSPIRNAIYADFSRTIMHIWILIFLNYLIDNEIFDVLDKLVAILYNNNNFSEIKIQQKLQDISWLRVIRFLYGRYAPEITDKEFGEIIVNDTVLWKRTGYFAFPCISLSVDEILELSKTGAKVEVLNGILPYICNLENKDYDKFCLDVIDDEAVLYLNDTTCQISRQYDAFKKITDAKPNLIISIDDNEYFDQAFPNSSELTLLNGNQLKSFLKNRSISFRGSIKKSRFFNAMISNKNNAINTILNKLELTEEMITELTELCVRHKNLTLLKQINENYGGKLKKHKREE